MDPHDRVFMRELLSRHQKATDAMIARSQAHSDAELARFNAITRRFDEATTRFAEHSREMRQDHREFVDELRAQRAALFRMPDRLDGGASSAGA